MARLIFITGTDTGVGKTVVTALLLLHLRKRGVKAIALKPFCSGSRDDVRLLQSLQPGELSDAVVNPFYFNQPVAPGAINNRPIALKRLVSDIRRVGKQADVVLIEGAGGVFVPIDRKLFIIDLIQALKAEVIVVSRNRLGTLNHTLLTIEALRTRGIRRLKIVLNDDLKPDHSSTSNERILRHLLPGVALERLPRSAKNLNKIGILHPIEKKLQKTLARVASDK